ncbi:MAG: hypothetical protein NXI23_07520 [Bacteroidetes bacterium]|nr:hypothetical protein [Bacteroidota bacterium]
MLHKSVQRNAHLAKVFYDLQLMEKEGSGYDKIYATLLSMGKPLPHPQEMGDRVKVSIEKRIIKQEVIQFMEKAHSEFQLRTKEIISLGLIAQNTSLTAIKFSRILGLDQPNAIRDWLGRLIDLDLLKQRGKTKGTIYFVKPELLKQLAFKGQTDLKNIEPHRLRALILEDLKIYKESAIGEIQERIGKEIPIRSIRSQLVNLLNARKIVKSGERKGTKYFIDENL